VSPEEAKVRELAAHPSIRGDEASLLQKDAALSEEFWDQSAIATLLTARHGRIPSSPELWDRIREKIEAAPIRRFRRPRRADDRFRAKFFWVAAAGLIVIVLGFGLAGRPSPVRREAPRPTVRAEKPVPAPLALPIEPRRVDPSEGPRPPEPWVPPEPEKRKDPETPPTPPPPKAVEEPIRQAIPAPPTAPPVEKSERTVAEKIAIAATLQRVNGEVAWIRPQGKAAARGGEKIPAGAGFEVGPGKSSAVASYVDHTKLELGADTTVREFFDADGTRGKRLFVAHGSVTASVVSQPQGLQMVITTPHAEARVLGTTLRILVDANSTRLEVREGRVQLTRLSDARAVEVPTGHYTVAAAEADLVVRPLVPLFAESFDHARTLAGRWKRQVGNAAVRTAGRLELDLGRPDSDWSGGGLQTKQEFAPSISVSADVEIVDPHASVVGGIAFIPGGQQRGGDAVFRIQLRGDRYGLLAEAGGTAREMAGAPRPGGLPCRERWTVEVEGNSVRFLVNGKEILRHRHDLRVAAVYAFDLHGAARRDAPETTRAAFDNVVVEKVR